MRIACPCCRADNPGPFPPPGTPVPCRRCKADLAPLAALVTRDDALRTAAVAALLAGDHPAAWAAYARLTAHRPPPAGLPQPPAGRP